MRFWSFFNAIIFAREGGPTPPPGCHQGKPKKVKLPGRLVGQQGQQAWRPPSRHERADPPPKAGVFRCFSAKTTSVLATVTSDTSDTSVSSRHPDNFLWLAVNRDPLQLEGSRASQLISFQVAKKILDGTTSPGNVTMARQVPGPGY